MSESTENLTSTAAAAPQAYLAPAHGSVADQAKARNLVPPTPGVTAGELRQYGYQLAADIVDDDDVYTVDAQSPTGFVWKPRDGLQRLRVRYALSAEPSDPPVDAFALAT